MRVGIQTRLTLIMRCENHGTSIHPDKFLGTPGQKNIFSHLIERCFPNVRLACEVCTGDRFFKLISNAVTSQKVRFWADIDLGGFNMFVRLKKIIFSDLEPLNMDIKNFEKHKAMGLERSSDYLKKLSKA